MVQGCSYSLQNTLTMLTSYLLDISCDLSNGPIGTLKPMFGY